MVVLDEERKDGYASIMSDGIFRLSDGIEDPNEIIDDVKYTLDGVP
jgi:cystathionine beta-lyase/cystathionine gamma-synthase